MQAYVSGVNDKNPCRIKTPAERLLSALLKSMFSQEGLSGSEKRGRLYFGQYTKSCYEGALSHVELDEKRIKKLENIREPGLAKAKEAMIRRRKAAYQELGYLEIHHQL